MEIVIILICGKSKEETKVCDEKEGEILMGKE